MIRLMSKYRCDDVHIGGIQDGVRTDDGIYPRAVRGRPLCPYPYQRRGAQQEGSGAAPSADASNRSLGRAVIQFRPMHTQKVAGATAV